MPIVEAVGVAAKVHNNKLLAKRIELAMTKAVLDANAEGISSSEENSVVLRERMMAARQAVIDEVRAAEEEIARAQERLRRAHEV